MIKKKIKIISKDKQHIQSYPLPQERNVKVPAEEPIGNLYITRGL